MFQTKTVEKIKKHISYSITFFRKSWHLWDTVEEYGTARQAIGDNKIRRKRFACWITEAANTLRMWNTYCSSTATTLTQTHLSITLYVQCVSCYNTFKKNVLNSWRMQKFLTSQTTVRFSRRTPSHRNIFQVLHITFPSRNEL